MLKPPVGNLSQRKDIIGAEFVMIHAPREASMKRFSLLAATALVLAIALPEDASARVGGFGGGGFHGGGFGGGGFRGAAIGGGGFRGGGFAARGIGPGGMRAAAIGGGFADRGIGLGGARAAAIGGGLRAADVGGFRGAGFRAGGLRPGFRGAIGPGVRVAGFRGGGSGWRGRRGLGWWGWPVAAGIGLGAWSYYDAAPYYDDPCLAWNGYAWVNVCY
jgi:hypothetical protein